MALIIVWTPLAKQGLTNLIKYLEEEWTSNEIIILRKNLEQVLKIISIYPEIFPTTKHISDLRKALVDKNNYLVYRLNSEKQRIEIINFRGTQQFPLK